MRYPSFLAPLRQHIRDLFTSPSLRSVSGLAVGILLATVIAIIGALVQARFVSPTDLGYLRGFLIVSGYVIFLNLGLFDAVHRLYPYYMGKGQKEKAIVVAEIGQAWNVSVSVVISGGFIILAVIAQISGNWRAMLAWAVQALLMFALIYGGYLSATYRSGHEFGTVAKGAVIVSIVNLSFLPLLPFWPYVGLAMRSSVGDFINMIYLHFHRPLHLPWRLTGESGWNWSNRVCRFLSLTMAAPRFGLLWNRP